MGKGLRTKDKTYATHTMHYELVEQEGHDLAIIENVAEYSEEHAKHGLPEDWVSESVVVDPRLFGQGTARTRRYIVLYRKGSVQQNGGISIQEVLECLKAQPTLGAMDYYWKEKADCPSAPLTQSQETI